MQLAQFMYQFKKEQLPCIHVFHEMFKVNAQVHTHNTRGSLNFHLPSVDNIVSKEHKLQWSFSLEPTPKRHRQVFFAPFI